MKFILRAAGFLLGLWLLLGLANTFLIKTDTLSYLSLHELTHRDDVDLAFIGSSVARNHFVPDVILEETGLASYNVAHPYTSMQGSIALAKVTFAHHNPRYTVLVAEPYMFEQTHESTQTQFRIMSFIENPLDRLSYYFDLCRQDERWLDRMLLPRQYAVDSFDDLSKTFRHHADVSPYFEHYAQYAGTDASSTYRGSGFMYPNPAAPESERLRLAAGRSPAGEFTALPAYSQQAILRFKALCEKNDSELMVVIFPYITSALLSTPNYLIYNALLRDFCAENGIPCFDFTLAKEELMPVLDPYYENIEHMSYPGAQLLTRAFCKVFTRFSAGEDVRELFYQSTEEYLASIKRVTNVWFDRAEPGAYLATSNHGTAVTPEYAFAAIAEDGSETILREYAADPAYTGHVPEDATLRVYARVKENDSPAAYYDLR